MPAPASSGKAKGRDTISTRNVQIFRGSFSLGVRIRSTASAKQYFVMAFNLSYSSLYNRIDERTDAAEGVGTGNIWYLKCTSILL